MNYKTYMLLKSRIVRFFWAFLGIIIIIPVEYQAQSPTNDREATFIPVHQYKTPTSPALTLLNFKSASIDHPTTQKDFILTTVGHFDDFINDPDFHPGFAVEFCPYQMKMGGAKYSTRQPSKSANLFQSICQTSSFSIVAMPRRIIGPDSRETSVGVGLRFIPIEGEISKEYKNSIDQLLAEYNTPFETEYSIRLETDTDYKKIRDENERMKIENRILKQVGMDFADEKIHRMKRLDFFTSTTPMKLTGWKLEFAGALASDLISTGSADTFHFDFDNSYFFNRWGAWFITGPEWEKGSIWLTGQFLGNGRYPDSLSINGGLRFIWDTKKWLSLSAEGLYSYLPNADNHHLGRIDAVAEVILSDFSFSVVLGLNTEKELFASYVIDGELIDMIESIME